MDPEKWELVGYERYPEFSTYDCPCYRLKDPANPVTSLFKQIRYSDGRIKLF